MTRIADMAHVTGEPTMGPLTQSFQEIVDLAVAQATAERAVRDWQRRNRPDELDKIWARYQEFTALVSRAPFQRKHNTRPWNLLSAKVTHEVALDSVLTVTGTSPERRTDRIEW